MQWKKLYKLHSRQSDTIVVVYPSFPKNIFSYCLGNDLLNDLALINALCSLSKPFKIIRGEKNTFNLEEKEIFINYTRHSKVFKGENYSESFLNLIKHLENKKNKVIPSLKEASFWENKNYMHQKFNDLGIPHPKTITVSKSEAPLDADMVNFPILFKPSHAAGSYGIKKLHTPQEYNKHLASTPFTEYLLQEWINMRSDLRLIFVGDKLMVHYWRINNDENWKPTSTSFGSSVDFDFLPSQWMDFIFTEYKKLNITTAAFDITWQNDDLDTKPYFLEVSPTYMPNPRIPKGIEFDSYSAFKKKYLGKDVYFKKFIDLVFDLKLELIQYQKNGQ